MPPTPVQRRGPNFSARLSSHRPPLPRLSLGGDRRRFQLHCLGFGNCAEEFEVLRAMARSLPDGAGRFVSSELRVQDLHSSMTTFSSSLTATRVATASTRRRRERRSAALPCNPNPSLQPFPNLSQTLVPNIIYEALPTP